jgi:hypothetical protein
MKISFVHPRFGQVNDEKDGSIVAGKLPLFLLSTPCSLIHYCLICRDQLWTNEGAYKPASSDEDFPPDLVEYPERGQGWMNEEGVRIDMAHRLIPKAPLRSALKQIR